jgi:apolipoprotein N-acyltransferase
VFPGNRLGQNSSTALGQILGGLALLYFASPGILGQGRWGLLAVPAMALWSLGASAVRGRQVWIEVGLGALAWAGICSWAAHVWWGTLLWIGPGMGLYMGLAGALLRLWVRCGFPYALAVPAAWMAAEGARGFLPLPFGFEWMRLGVHLHDLPWVAGSARCLGLFGLGWVAASLGGWCADLARGRRDWRSAAMGLAPAGAAVLAAWWVPAPQVRIGPAVLLVQPGIAQERKMEGQHWSELLEEGLRLTADGLRAARADGLEPELVVWGETMLPLPVPAPDLEQALAQGARPDPWREEQFDEALVSGLRQRHAELERLLFGEPRGAERLAGLLPRGAAFLFGAEYLGVRHGRIRRQNAAFLWSAPGLLAGPAGKWFLVPGAETMLGLEAVAGVRKVVSLLAGYVPDLTRVPPAEQPRSLLWNGSGGPIELAIAVCFDNAFEAPFASAARISAGRASPTDLVHVVLSNEAWFKHSQEADQMLAFSRLAAIATGRPVVRATNSGISCLFDPSGKLVRKLELAGRDREVAGTLACELPLAASRAPTPFVRWGEALSSVASGLVLALGILGWVRDRLSRRSGVP